MESSNVSYSTHPVEFSGKGGEYFKIWIVNLLLSIVTLGIYSAWAKVRTNQYFYGHTKLNGHSFRYLAKPMQILKGRIIALFVFVTYLIVSSLSPLIGMLAGLFFFFLVPWLVVQGLKFNLRMSSYRNVRFSFTGTYGEAFVNFVLLPVLSIFTLHLAFPWVLKRIDKFMLGNITYGGKPLQVENRTGKYYQAALIALGMGVIISIIAGVVFGAFGLSLASLGQNPDPSAGMKAGAIITFVITMVLYWIGFTLVGSVYKSMIRNHLLAETEIEGIATFESNMEPVSFTVLQLTNVLIVLCTLGLGFPIAKVRNADYMANATNVSVSSEAENVVDKIANDPNAFGEEAADFFDVDLSLT